MKKKKTKYFDSVQMTIEIRDAMYRQRTDPNFDSTEFKKIKVKWTKLLKLKQKVQGQSAMKAKSQNFGAVKFIRERREE